MVFVRAVAHRGTKTQGAWTLCQGRLLSIVHPRLIVPGHLSQDRPARRMCSTLDDLPTCFDHMRVNMPCVICAFAAARVRESIVIDIQIGLFFLTYPIQYKPWCLSLSAFGTGDVASGLTTMCPGLSPGKLESLDS